MDRPPLPPRRNPSSQSGSNRPPPLPPRKPSQGSAQQRPAPYKSYSGIEHPPHLVPSLSGNFFTTSSPPSCLPAGQKKGYYVGRGCPSGENLLHDAFWFRHIDVPGFSTCSRCFEFYVRNSIFELDFTGKLEPGQNYAARCMFGVPRMADKLWPEAVTTRDLQSVKAYMEVRAKIPNCHGMGGVSGTALVGLKWFQAKHNAIPGLVACEACYNAFIVGSSFERRFRLHDHQPTQKQTWACDIAVPNITRAFAEHSEVNDWPKFVAAATSRLSKPSCAGFNAVSSASRDWYGIISGDVSVVICETCFLDSMALTAFDKQYKPKLLPKENKETQLICDLAIPALKAAYGAALGYEKHDIFWNTCKVQIKTPICKGAGMAGVQWYTLKGGCNNFDVCPTCYSGFICAFGMQIYFQPQKKCPPGTTKMCDFCAEAPNFAKTIIRYHVALETPDTEQFITHIRRMASIFPCTGVKQQVAQFWRIGLRGDPMGVCPACYEDVLRERPLSHYFNHESSPGKHLCELYSANMRRRWRAVQEASAIQNIRDANNNYLPDETALANFIAYREHRTQVFIETVPVMDQLLAAAQMRLFEQKRLNMNSSFYNNLDRMSSTASGIHYGPLPRYTTTYGNSSVGHGFATPWGVEGAAYGQQAAAVASQGGGDFARVAYLEARWKEVE
ncbi:hypothetical protein M436DRAFT_58579 [Aureobasidium namibiae CBS 147.97]|uniref:Integral membrane protein n=1 Tax=Aureobasidium namibiae CBS 147.97 TaxID=1043004 RepID=A0A074W5C6_9PEZI|nr:uncharacterized protein M436DRAFT_58579 [Aureobasidium namibiae CBS 147.97]KEQ68335.1 hypothetical protein M436DRAFT_58579 [Aureobasidium namibiae CBS 147.97]